MIAKFITVFLLIVASACSWVGGEAPLADVDPAATAFFDQLNSARFEEIYEGSSQSFKDARGKTEIIDNLKQLAATGQVRDHKRLSMSFQEAKEGRIASPVYAVVLDTMRAEVTLNFKDEGGDWKLFGFLLKQRLPSP
jgi:hypothetical protein